jgi:hypothetical protein
VLRHLPALTRPGSPTPGADATGLAVYSQLNRHGHFFTYQVAVNSSDWKNFSS